ncbi:MAG: primosomal protein N', partial [Paraprevotella sp.]|nr:primosomal protein N' [Paraprevotella sp.]
EKIGLEPLSEAQQHDLVSIENEWKHSSVCLLHGVTSSGKTEVYIHLIQQMIQKGKQVLYLVPEIALTTQLTERLSRVFGEKFGVYHSKFPDAERVERGKKQISESPYDVILGVRSSIFLPFKDLGLVIVDEEHEQTYKQQEPAPRYHARNAAIVLAQMYGAKTLLGTATPSLESYYNVRIGKYGLVEMKERFGQVQLPSVQVVDIKELQRKKRMVGPFSTPLLEQMRSALQANEQVILFQNRRGYAPHLECHTCGWVPRCPKCDVSLTYHKRLNKMTCHYCGYIGTVPVCCPACEEEKLSQHGYGTEKVEDAVKHLFPEATVARMDLDTTRTRAAYEQIISDFQHGRTNVLIGTQMVTKGLDFERVGVVGILNADTMMNVPDFRSFERAYQLMAQVAGRAGRRSTQGRVVLQTKSPELPIVTQVVTYDYEGLYTQQMEERRMFLFPPFCRLIYVYMKHKNADVLDKLATEMSQRLRSVFGQRVLGPDVPPVARIQALYIRKIMIKVEPGISMPKVRQQLLSVRNQVVGQTI